VTAAWSSATGLLLLRADSAFYSAAVVAACKRAGARFSITVKIDAAVRRAIESIPEDAWTPIRYPRAVWDDDEQRWVSDAEIAEIGYTAFTSRPKAAQAAGRLVVRRVRRLNPASAPQGQGELFAVYRYHAAFTDSGKSLVDAEADHRDHAVVEQVISDLKNSALAHLPGVVHGQRGVVDLGLSGVQPHPRGRGAGRPPPRPGEDRHGARPAGGRARPAGALGPQAGAAPARGLALARRRRRPVRHAARAAGGGLTFLTARPRGPDRRPVESRADRRVRRARGPAVRPAEIETMRLDHGKVRRN
jgi:hypothetical protein